MEIQLNIKKRLTILFKNASKFKLPKGYALTAKFHNFSEESGDGDALGNELDLIIAKGFQGFKLVGGYSHFFEPSAVADLPATKNTQNWAWLMLVIKPKFLYNIHYSL